jgi:hypothetical protein
VRSRIAGLAVLLLELLLLELLLLLLLCTAAASSTVSTSMATATLVTATARILYAVDAGILAVGHTQSRHHSMRLV